MERHLVALREYNYGGKLIRKGETFIGGHDAGILIKVRKARDATPAEAKLFDQQAEQQSAARVEPTLEPTKTEPTKASAAPTVAAQALASETAPGTDQGGGAPTAAGGPGLLDGDKSIPAPGPNAQGDRSAEKHEQGQTSTVGTTAADVVAQPDAVAKDAARDATPGRAGTYATRDMEAAPAGSTARRRAAADEEDDRSKAAKDAKVGAMTTDSAISRTRAKKD